MKKSKIIIISFIIGIIIASSIGVYAMVNANSISYKDGKTVEQALNELYANRNNTSNITSGEAWLIANKEITAVNNLSVFQFKNLDFSNIKTITAHFSDTHANNTFLLRNLEETEVYLDLSNPTVATEINIEEYRNSLSNIKAQVNLQPGMTFYIDGYTTY